MILSLVRHGLPARVPPGPDAADPPLSPLGRQQMNAARALVERDGYDVVWCSPLRRARESVEALLPGVEVIVDMDLAEFDRDADRYLHWEDGAEVYQQYLQGDLSFWGTTREAFRDRVATVAERIRVESPGSRVLAVTHGGVINNFFAHLIGSPKTVLFQPEYGSINRFEYHPEEGWTPNELNVHGPAGDGLSTGRGVI
jgi:broad specificity phosphatase PhoE